MKTLLHPRTTGLVEALAQQPAGSVIFHGARGLGKFTAAKELASIINCLGEGSDQCANCRQIAAANFPDFISIDRGEKASIAIEQIRTLTSDLSLRPYRAGGARLVVIDDAHLLTTEAQNALLKLLEEPPPHTLVILVAQRLETLLLTVRSRCRVVHFLPPDPQALSALLATNFALEAAPAEAIAALSAGAPGTAITLAANPAEAQALLALTRDTTDAQKSSLFERLLLAGRLISANADLEHFGQTLHKGIVVRLTLGQITAAHAATRLNALERFRTQLAAKVTPRVALERLMLELG